MGYLIPIDKIPSSGVLLVTVHFSDYKSNYANDTRRKLGGGDRNKGLVKEAEELNLSVDLFPLNYWLGRTIIEKVTRSTGGLYKFGFSNMTPDAFKGIYTLLKEKQSKIEWWEYVEISIADRVEGFK